MIEKVVMRAVEEAYAMGTRDGRKEAAKIIALLREETLAWRNLAVQGELMDGDTAAANRRLNAAMAATDEAGVLKGDQ